MFSDLADGSKKTSDVMLAFFANIANKIQDKFSQCFGCDPICGAAFKIKINRLGFLEQTLQSLPFP